MTIDDFIDTYKSYANDYRKQVYDMGYSTQQRDYSLSKAREYEQLAEWLEELKDLKKYEHRTVEELNKIYLDGYEDALDDFMNKILEFSTPTNSGLQRVVNILSGDVKLIAEQLKEQK